MQNFPDTVRCHYDAVQYNMIILHTVLHWLGQNINQRLYSQQTPHISPSRMSYGVFIVRIWEKTDGVATAPHCIWRLFCWVHLKKHKNMLFSINGNPSSWKTSIRYNGCWWPGAGMEWTYFFEYSSESELGICSGSICTILESRPPEFGINRPESYMCLDLFYPFHSLFMIFHLIFPMHWSYYSLVLSHWFEYLNYLIFHDCSPPHCWTIIVEDRCCPASRWT